MGWVVGLGRQVKGGAREQASLGGGCDGEVAGLFGNELWVREVQQASLEVSCGLRWKLNGGGRTSLEAVGGGCHGLGLGGVSCAGRRLWQPSGSHWR